MTTDTLTIRNITYRAEGDLIGAACTCGADLPVAEMPSRVPELKAWIAEHDGHQNINERAAA